MRFIKILSMIASFLAFILLGTVSYANTAQMNTTLARIYRLLNQVNPLINLAQKQQDPNTRVRFQFNVLKQDIASIQSGIHQAMHHVSIQPRLVKPLSDDYLSMPNSVLKKENPLKSEDGAS